VRRPGSNPLQRLYAAAEARRVRDYESALHEKADLVLAVTEQVAAGLLALQPRLRVRTVPIGVVLEDYPCLWQAGTPRIALCGDMSWPPNVEAALHLCQDVLPLLRGRGLDVPVVLAGRSPAAEVRALAGPDVQVTGAVPRMDEVLRGDTIAVAPLRAGSGMRVKILEAMAWGLPVVSTPLGCEGIDHAGALLEAGGSEAFAAALGRLLADRSLRRQLGQAGRERVAALYGHQASGRRFLDALAEPGLC
jgi:glycosyltransferase involved in cell wall biosynthesis